MYPLGSHLVSSRGFYAHYRIYIGNEQVIHYAELAEGLKKDCIRKVALSTFKGTGDISIY